MAATIPGQRVYDSTSRPGVRDLLREGWGHRELIVLLARRDLGRQYGTTVLGPWWTLATPLAYAAALWAIFSGVRGFKPEGVPFVAYVLSGVIILTFVSQAVFSVASSVVTNTVALRRVFVPVGTFAVATALASLASLAIMTAALLVVDLAAGERIPWTVALLPLLFVLVATGAAGFGLLVGAVATVFADAIEATRILLTLLGFVTPVFYPVSVVPHRFRFLLEANPLYHFLTLFRHLVYVGALPGWGTLAACVGTAAAAVVAGASSFALVRRALPTVL